jgi:hypothetical protein
MKYPRQRYKYQPWVQVILDNFLAFDAVAYKAMKIGFVIEKALYFDIADEIDNYQQACDSIQACICHDVTDELIEIMASVDVIDLRTIFKIGYLELIYRKKMGEHLVVSRRRLFDFNTIIDSDQVNCHQLPIDTYTPMRFSECNVDELDITDEMNRLDQGCSIELAAAMLCMQEGDLHFELF